jgi:(p)ppGpp synthase/HD superfamily hydrolase
MAEMQGQLEDLSFKFVYPKEYELVKKMRDEKLAGKEQFLKQKPHQVWTIFSDYGLSFGTISRSPQLTFCPWQPKFSASARR